MYHDSICIYTQTADVPEGLGTSVEADEVLGVKSIEAYASKTVSP